MKLGKCRFSWCAWMAAVVMWMCDGALALSEGPPPVLHKTTYQSPSKKVALTVNPGRLHGGGAGKYRVEREGVVVWEKELDFTLWEATVCDDGSVAGYGYTSGWRGFDGDGYGEFVVAIIEPEGTVKLCDRREREATGQFHGPPGPTAQGCFVNASGSKLVVRFRSGDFQDRTERWEVYGIQDGKRGEDVTLKSPPVTGEHMWYMCLDVKAVPGTELSLVVWYRSLWEPRQSGVRLALVDSGANEVWSVERVSEFDAMERFIPLMIDALKLVPEPEGASFSFRSPADQARFVFVVEKDGAEWRVRESARVVERVGVDVYAETGLSLPLVELASRGEIRLKSGEAGESAALWVMDFDFDAKGRIGFVSRRGEDVPVFVLYSADGALEKSIRLEGMAGCLPRAVCVGEDRWVLFSSPPGDGSVSRAVVLSVVDGTTKEIEGFSCPRSFSQDVKGTKGGFAVLGDYTDTRVAMFDVGGKQMWAIGSPTLSPQDIAIGSKGEVGVLGVIRNEICVFDGAGRAVRTIDLEKTLGKKPNYVAGLEADAGGGWILYDFGGNPTVYRLDAEGKPGSSFTPRFADGRVFRVYGNVVRAPDGRLWTSDHSSLLRLTDEGVVDFVIGRKPDVTGLGEVRCVAVDSRGSIYAVDGNNASVHVFDREGNPLRRLVPDPKDFETDGGLGAITVAGDGSVFYQPNTHSSSNRGYLKFNADGSRAGFQDAISGEVSDDWAFRPGTQERLVLGYERAFLVDAEGKKTRVIERDANDAWLDKPGECAFAPDGSFAIVASPSNWWQGLPPRVTWFAADGEAKKTFDLPRSFVFARCATNGRSIVVIAGETGVVIDIASGAMGAWTVPQMEGNWLMPFISPDGSEVWCFDYEAKKAFRFAMPVVAGQR